MGKTKINKSCSVTGWLSVKCDTPCSAGLYGEGCNQPCACANDALCHHITGACECPPGWTGTSCNLICSVSSQHGNRLKGYVALDRSSWSMKNVWNRLL